MKIKKGTIMTKKILLFVLAVLILAGCSKCILVRSEYYDITGKVLEAKAEDAEIAIYTEGQTLDRPYAEIGAIKVMGRHGVSKEAFNRELQKRARVAGADAVIEVQYVEDKANDLPICGKLLSTKRNMTATGKAIVFTEK